MKKIIYCLILMSVVIAFQSCEEVDYKNIDITKDTREVDIKEFTEDLTSHIVIKDITGVSLTETDMGKIFYVIDNTEGGADSRSWKITHTKEGVTNSTDQLVKLVYSLPGKVTVELTSTRSSDGATQKSTEEVTINSIPVTADFMTLPIAENGVVTIKTGDYVSFVDQSTGLPEMWDWTLSGGTPAVSTEQNPVIRYEVAGNYDVALSATRDDAGDLVNDVITRSSVINVEQRIVKHKRSIVTDKEVRLDYTEPMMADIASMASEFSVKIVTAGGAEIIPSITKVELDPNDDTDILLTISEQTYSDDKVYVTVNDGSIKDATMLTLGEGLKDDLCLYGKSWILDGGYEDGGWSAGTNASNSGTKEIVTDPVFQGLNSLHLIKDSGTASFVNNTKFNLEPGADFIIEFEGMKKAGAGGGIELRFTTGGGNGTDDGRIGDGIGGNWTGANQFGDGFWKHFTKVKKYTGSGHSDVYIYWLFYGNGEVWVDNVKVYTPDPRP